MTTLQQANNLLSLKRAVKQAIGIRDLFDKNGNTMTVYEPFTGLYVKVVRANIKSRWYVYGSGKKQTLAASLFGDNSSIIYVSE